jgi:glycosyltransferase involved in cell wall biosynthesis
MKVLSLSICIPTYNRATLLEIQLERVLMQIQKDNLQDYLEVVISNNTSTDSTTFVVNKLMQAFSGVNYVVQEKNIGLYNIVEVVKYAKGKFIWIISDDDLIIDGALKFLIDTIAVNSDLKMITGSVINQKNFHNAIIMDKNSSLQTLGNNIAYLSFCVFRNENIKFEMPQDSLIPHSYIFLDVMSKEGQHIFSSTQLLEYRKDNETSYSFFKAFYADMYQLYLYALKIGYSKIYLDKMISMLTLGILGRLDAIQNSRTKINQQDLVKHFKLDKTEAYNIIEKSFPQQFYLEKRIIRYSLSFPIFLSIVMFGLNSAFAIRRYIMTFKRDKTA